MRYDQQGGREEAARNIVKLGRSSAIAVLAVVYIAQNTERTSLSGARIAEGLGTAQDYLLKILQQLVKARILESDRGPSGGYRLRQSSSTVRLLDVVEAIEGKLSGEIVGKKDFAFGTRSVEVLEEKCKLAADFARGLLADSTIADMLEDQRANG